VGTRGLAGEQVELGAASDTGGRCRKVREGKGTKGSERVVGKSGGGRTRLYSWRMAGLADEVGSDTPYRTRQAVRVVTGPLNRKA
jgi:hypothetical protein